MGLCTSRSSAAAKKQQKQQQQNNKKKKKSRSKIYSSSMDFIQENEADRVSGIPQQRKTPYSRGGASIPQVTQFGFRRRGVVATSPQQSTFIQPPLVAPEPPVNAHHPGRCSPHFPPTPPTAHHETTTSSPIDANKPSTTSGNLRPLKNRFGFKLSPRCTAVLNNINAQIVATSDAPVDPNCNPLTLDSTTMIATNDITQVTSSNSSLTSSNASVTNGNTNQVTKSNLRQPSLLPKPKSKSDNQSRLPAPKNGAKIPRPNSNSNTNNSNKPTIAKPVVAKPVVRPNTKIAKTEANRMVALQRTDSSSPGSAISSGCGTLSSGEAESSHGIESHHTPRRTPPRVLEIVKGPRGTFDVRDKPPTSAPTAKPEDLDDDEQEEKAFLDENLSEKPIWTETLPDECSSSSNSYSEGIEEQQFPDKSAADSLFSSYSSASSASSTDDQPIKNQAKKKSSGSLSQLSDGSSGQRDFLIDDEIADQPGLTFMAEDGGDGYDDDEYLEEEEEDERVNDANYNNEDTTFNVDETTYVGEEGEETLETENSQQPDTLIQDMPPSIQGVSEEGGVEAQASPVGGSLEPTPVMLRRRRRHRHHSASTGTLSPCESLTSDDLMIDFEDSTLSSIHSREDRIDALLLKKSGEIDFDAVSEASLELYKRQTDNFSSPRPLAQLRRRTSSGSAGSADFLQQTAPTTPPQQGRGGLIRGSPLRPPRSTSATGAILDTEDGYVRLEWTTYQSIKQDIVTTKTQLLRLKRILEEADVRNPFDSSLKQNGMYYSLAHSESMEKRDDSEECREPSSQEENADLRRQVVFLQQQMSDKDRTIHLLQQQMSKYCGVSSTESTASSAQQSGTVTANVATQTERMRPLSTGTALSQSYPSEGGPLVSSTESLRRRSASSTPFKTNCSASGTISNRSMLPRKLSSDHSSKSPTKTSGLPRKIPTKT